MTLHKSFPATPQPVSLLRRILQFDACTGVASIPLALASSVVAPLLGTPITYLLIKFVVFGLYGVWLFAALRQEPISRGIGWVAVGFNTLVTLESAAILLLNVYPLTSLGRLFLVLQIVGGPILIAVQYIGVRRYY